MVGNQSEIYIYDIRRYRQCVNKLNDSGNYYTNCMEISRDNMWLSTGSKNGYVNMYSLEEIKNSASDCDEVEPKKVFDNLTTSCSFIQYSSNSVVMGMCSKWKKNAFR